MADFTTLDVTKNDDQAICEKMEGFVSLTGLEADFETVGVVRNESTFNVTSEFIEHKDGFADWALCKIGETLTFEGAFMQPGVAKLIALSTGRQSIDTSDTLYEDVLFTSSRTNPAKLRWKFVGETKGGKAVEIEILKGQCRSDFSLSFGSDFAEAPFTIQAVKDDSSTELYDVARYRVEK